MTLNKVFVIFFLLFQNSLLIANDENGVVYGNDDRKDLFEINNIRLLNLARSTAAMISNKDISKIDDGVYNIKGKPLSSLKVCKSERYFNQITSAYCSGFLIAPDLLVTAGHCVKSKKDCKHFSWIFDYSVFQNGDYEETDFNIDKNNVFRCKKIISHTLSEKKKNDYSLIQLDRIVKNRKPLLYRKTGKIVLGTELLVIGHPSGLPTKIADNAYVRKNESKNYFVANLDTFSGNSGSAVLDSKTGIVEGILVRGEQDYIMDKKNKCLITKKCNDTGCAGEEMTRITNIKYLLDN